VSTIDLSPGPAAAEAFRLGVAAGAAVGLTAIGLLYWWEAVSALVAGFLLVVLFPVYLVAVAAALSGWLGYDKDSTALRPVTRPPEE